ncbi:thiol reductant ABC exporter subunit CydC [Tessaracoccus caeni]|uniref:thiol reductant ABC exporter subunit CydC n=1 Tax=Tessaracoccus caeni TaxID=3031239 RepID=UPI0023DC6790|nr:thiol reductant ABC exporter subunit CydC [Tessaracoccus caeni]MDF1487285.1 thiol reductant ABC exporter subunit CydC [Tessaracoccus caeni]
MRRTFSFTRALLDSIPRGRWRLLGAVLLAFAASAASVALMGVSAFLLSWAALFPPVLYLQAPAVGVRFFGISRGVFRYVERLVGHDLALRMQGALRLKVYDKLASTTLIGRRRGDLLTRVVADVEAIQDLVVRVIIPIASATLVIATTTVLLSLINLPSALVLLATAILGGVLLPWWAQRASLRADEATIDARGRLSDEVRELTRVGADLVANGAEAEALNRLLTVDDQLRTHEEKAAWVRGIATAGQIVAAGVAVVAALAIGGPALAAGDIDPRFFAVLVLTPLALHETFAAFTQGAQTYTRSRAALGRIADELAAPSIGEGDAVPGDGAPALELDDVTVGWPGGAPVQHDVTLRVSPGERVALVGPSGVGKTTIAATIMGLIPPLTGRLERAGRVGYLAQDAHIFATSVAENVRIGNKDATDDEVRQALHRAGLDLPLDRLIGEAGSTLSGGERRRLALARILSGPRDLLILDEPTEHLDHATAAALIDDVWAASEGLPVLVITHDQGLVARCDRSVTLSDARTPRALRGAEALGEERAPKP